MQFNFILSMIFALFVAIFAIVNSEPVTINLFFKTINSNMAVVIFFSTALGGLIVFLFNTFTSFRKNREIKSVSKEKTSVELELEKAKETIENYEKEIDTYKKEIESLQKKDINPIPEVLEDTEEL